MGSLENTRRNESQSICLGRLIRCSTKFKIVGTDLGIKIGGRDGGDGGRRWHMRILHLCNCWSQRV